MKKDGWWSGRSDSPFSPELTASHSSAAVFAFTAAKHRCRRVRAGARGPRYFARSSAALRRRPRAGGRVAGPPTTPRRSLAETLQWKLFRNSGESQKLVKTNKPSSVCGRRGALRRQFTARLRNPQLSRIRRNLNRNQSANALPFAHWPLSKYWPLPLEERNLKVAEGPEDQNAYEFARAVLTRRAAGAPCWELLFIFFIVLWLCSADGTGNYGHLSFGLPALERMSSCRSRFWSGLQELSLNGRITSVFPENPISHRSHWPCSCCGPVGHIKRTRCLRYVPKRRAGAWSQRRSECRRSSALEPSAAIHRGLTHGCCAPRPAPPRRACPTMNTSRLVYYLNPNLRLLLLELLKSPAADSPQRPAVKYFKYFRQFSRFVTKKKKLVACKVGIRAKVLRDNDFEWARGGRPFGAELEKCIFPVKQRCGRGGAGTGPGPGRGARMKVSSGRPSPRLYVVDSSEV
ncbi:hypothetical protein EVAR_32761_1 [Eumeta japonica]|uniref:Uncharacterized protein n=1 Tax=Eumeta variegata TaxID=151549 RepID=A0A4C1XNH2_EUMVA|nr:hypothetical protein EVAR_32761_1 [Eumeta japonica]